MALVALTRDIVIDSDSIRRDSHLCSRKCLVHILDGPANSFAEKQVRKRFGAQPQFCVTREGGAIKDLGDGQLYGYATELVTSARRFSKASPWAQTLGI